MHPGYIAWEEYQSNHQRVKSNAVAWSPERCRGPAREGTALLQGLVICGIERMSVRYHSHRNQSVPTYWCGRRPLQRGESGLCQTVHGIKLLVRFQPVASDMREVISAMKISTSLERIADESVTIARRAKRLNARPAMRELALLEPPHHLALVIFRDSIRVFADGDCEHARTLKLKDRELDALTDDVTDTLSEQNAQCVSVADCRSSQNGDKTRADEPVVLGARDRQASVRENCLPVIASAWNQSRHLSLTVPPDSTVKAQSSSLVRLPRTPRASSLEIMRR